MEHPITPPPELITRWDNEAATANMPDQRYIAIRAARWGADQELEACCGWIESLTGLGGLLTSSKFRCTVSDYLRAARRPKPPSLKQQALKALDSFEGFTASLEKADIIRRALESIPDPQD